MKRHALFARVSLVGLWMACGTVPEPAHLLYEQDAQSLDNPLPDLRLVQDGHFVPRPGWYRPFMMEKALNGRMVKMLEGWAEGARSVQGVGNLGPTLLRVSEPVDKASFVGKVLRLRRVGEGYRVLERDVLVEHSKDSFAQRNQPFPADFPEFLFTRPSIPLPEHEEGLLVVLRGPTTLEGVELGRGRSFASEKASLEFARAAAAALEVPEADVLLALPLKAQQTKTTLRQLTQWARSQPPTTFTVPPKAILGGSEPVGIWASTEPDWATMQSWLNKWPFANPSTDVGQVVLGTFPSVDLRGATGAWDPALVANPSAAPRPELKFVLTLPKGPRPAGGYRVVLGAHGLNGRNSLKVGSPNGFCSEVAQLLAKAGMGCLGIDSVNHGSRGATFDFFDLDSMAITRENFRQSVFDLIQLGLLARSLDVDADGAPDLSPDLGYFGNSLGAILGGAAVSYIPEVRTAVLNAGGGELGNVLTSKDIQDKIGLLIVAKTGVLFESPEYFASFPLFRAFGQLVLEATDPINLTDTPMDKAVLLQEGLGDITIPNFTSEHLAAAMGLSLANESRSGTDALRVLVRVDPARYLKPERAATYNGHNVFWDFAPPREQAIKFLGSQGTQLFVE
jgi:hypothetical protein